MKLDNVRESAERFIATQDMKGWTAKFSQTHDPYITSKEWTVVFDLYSPEGTIVDGSIIVRVDKKTLEARYGPDGL